MTNMSSMFSGSYPNMMLTTIYVSDLWNMSSVTSSSEMFKTCVNLPNYNSNYIDKTRAYYGGDGRGYLTYKAAQTTP